MRPSNPTNDQRDAAVPTSGQPRPAVLDGIGVLHRLVRTMLHTLGLDVCMHILAPLIGQRPLPKELFDLASPLGFLPWSLAFAAGLNADRLAITLLTLCLLAFGWPDHLMPYLVPVIVGLLVGTGLRAITLREQSS
jgi:hypothetical protein